MVNDDTPVTTPEQSEQWAVFEQVFLTAAFVACSVLAFIFLVLKD